MKLDSVVLNISYLSWPDATWRVSHWVSLWQVFDNFLYCSIYINIFVQFSASTGWATYLFLINPTLIKCTLCIIGSFFKKINLFIIYLCLTALGLHFCTRAFSSCGERGLLFVAVRRLLIVVASLVTEHRL